MGVATTAAVRSATDPYSPSPESPADQHELWRSILLHLTPGVLLGVFIVAVVPLLERWEVDPLFALFGGIGLVPVPFELGYLTWYARRTTGSWSPLAAVSYREPLPWRRTMRLAVRLAAWFTFVLVIWIAVAERWVADTLFAWLPAAIHDFSRMEGDAPTGAALVALLAIAFVFNGVVGPVTEELYFRGHLLPRLERRGASAPLIGTVLFALYHVWTPWRWPMIVAGFLPTARQVRRHRSVRIGIATHMTINVVFLLMLTSAMLSAG
jgi:membrane protease YdiL (CAAX protease family)